MHTGWMAQGRRTFAGERGWGRASIWLNRNGRGDIFKPGKVWCLAVTRGRAGRASHKFTLSYHLIATIAALAHGASQEVGRNLALEKSPWNYRWRPLRAPGQKLYFHPTGASPSAGARPRDRISSDMTRRRLFLRYDRECKISHFPDKEYLIYVD